MNGRISEETILTKIWRILSPVVVLFLVSQIAGSLAGFILMEISGIGSQVFTRYAQLITGISSLFVIGAAWYIYRKDEKIRLAGEEIPYPVKLFPAKKEGILLVVMGAAYAQYGSLLVKILKDLFHNTSMEGTASSMMGDNLMLMFLYVGIIAPIAEEMIFRWLVYLRMRERMPIVMAVVLSGALFGAYHMNVTQGIYAGILGMICAWVLERSGSLVSCILIHSGANIFATIMSVEKVNEILMRNIKIHWVLLVILLAALAGGIWYYMKKSLPRR